MERIGIMPYRSSSKGEQMALARMRSIYEALDLIKNLDPQTALTYTSIKRLCLEGKIRYFRSGKKIILNYDDLINFLGVSEEN